MADLPAPVGSTASVSWPARTARIGSSWPARSASNPKRSWATRRICATASRGRDDVGMVGDNSWLVLAPRARRGKLERKVDSTVGLGGEGAGGDEAKPEDVIGRAARVRVQPRGERVRHPQPDLARGQ